MSLRTFASVCAAPQVDQGAAPSPTLPEGYAVSIAPASAPVARSGRQVAAGSYPCWLVQTDNSGAERCRVLVQSAAPLYLAKGTGAHWWLVAGSGVASGTDVAWDVTIGDDPGDWMESSLVTGGLRQEQTFYSPIVNQNFTSNPWATRLPTPAWATALDVLVHFPSGSPAALVQAETQDGQIFQVGSSVVSPTGAAYWQRLLAAGRTGANVAGQGLGGAINSWGALLPTAFDITFTQSAVTGTVLLYAVWSRS